MQSPGALQLPSVTPNPGIHGLEFCDVHFPSLIRLFEDVCRIRNRYADSRRLSGDSTIPGL
jgi:hypothetical protein